MNIFAPQGQVFENPIASGFEFLFGRQAGSAGTESVFGDLGGGTESVFGDVGESADVVGLFGGDT